MTLETANRLYELRKKNNLSQEELAEKLGVSRQAVSKWERSEASPDTDNLIALAKIYNLSLDELIYGEKEENKEEPQDNLKEDNTTEDTEDSEDVYIDINDGEDKVKISSEGIVVEEKNGNTVRINVNGKLMEKVIKKIEDKIDESDEYDEYDEYDEDEDGDYANEKVYVSGDGKVKIRLNRGSFDVKKPKFWLEVPYPVICALAYLIFGFYDICGGWALSWIIFVTIPVYYTFVEAIYKKRFAEFCYPVFCVVVYLVCGLYFHNWHPSWLIFVTVPIYYPIADALDKMIRNRSK